MDFQLELVDFLSYSQELIVFLDLMVVIDLASSLCILTMENDPISNLPLGLGIGWLYSFRYSF